MAVVDFSHSVDKRDRCYGLYGNYNCRSNFHYWGRWVLLGVIIVVAIAVGLLLTCIARRRRRRGVQPMYGTGWMAPQTGKFGTNPQYQYNPDPYGYGYNQAAPPPPAYGQPQAAQYTGTTFNPNDGYYGQQGGVQSPANTYQPNNAYAPPQGPPPGKTAV